MQVSFLLRLVPEALSESRIVGRIEVVETGEQVTLRDAEELIGFLQAHGQRRLPSEPDPELAGEEPSGSRGPETEGWTR